MRKKIVVITLLASAILAGLLFITPLGKAIMSRYEVDPVAAVTNPSTLQLQLPLPLPSSESTRTERWQRAKKSLSFEQTITELLNDNDPESPALALHLNITCSEAHAYKSIARSIAEEERRLSPKNAGDIIPPDDKIPLKSVSFIERCGTVGAGAGAGAPGAGMGRINDAIQKALAAGSVSTSTGRLKIETAAEHDALNKLLLNPELTYVWLARHSWLFLDAAKNKGYLEDLEDQRYALFYTVVCNFGADCADDGVTRFNACLLGKLCVGNSVAESVAAKVGADQIGLIAERADKIALEIATNRADFFKPRPNQ